MNATQKLRFQSVRFPPVARHSEVSLLCGPVAAVTRGEHKTRMWDDELQRERAVGRRAYLQEKRASARLFELMLYALAILMLLGLPVPGFCTALTE